MNSLYKVFFAFCSVCLVACNSGTKELPPSWKVATSIVKNPAGSAYIISYDSNSKRNRNGITAYWIRYDWMDTISDMWIEQGKLTKDMSEKDMDSVFLGYLKEKNYLDTTLAQIEANCKDRTIRKIAIKNYKNNISTSSDPDEQSFLSPAPGTIGQTLFALACN